MAASMPFMTSTYAFPPQSLVISSVNFCPIARRAAAIDHQRDVTRAGKHLRIPAVTPGVGPHGLRPAVQQHQHRILFAWRQNCGGRIIIASTFVPSAPSNQNVSGAFISTLASMASFVMRKLLQAAAIAGGNEYFARHGQAGALGHQSLSVAAERKLRVESIEKFFRRRTGPRFHRINRLQRFIFREEDRWSCCRATMPDQWRCGRTFRIGSRSCPFGGRTASRATGRPRSAAVSCA